MRVAELKSRISFWEEVRRCQKAVVKQKQSAISPVKVTSHTTVVIRGVLVEVQIVGESIHPRGVIIQLNTEHATDEQRTYLCGMVDGEMAGPHIVFAIRPNIPTP